MKTYPNVWSEFYSSPWAIIPSKLDEIETALHAIIKGDNKAYAELPTTEQAKYQQVGDVAIVPISGTISTRPSVFSSGGTSYNTISKMLGDAVANKTVNNIVLDIHSPGGMVFGIDEMVSKIESAKAIKPVYAVANHTAASAAYWIGSQANKFYVSPNGQVGSIGVMVRRIDATKQAEIAGVVHHVIASTSHKTEGDPYRAMSAEESDYLQEQVDKIHARFVSAVARGRGLSENRVTSDFGKGRMLLDENAVSAGMVDGIATLESVVERLRSVSSRNRTKEAMKIYSDTLTM